MSPRHPSPFLLPSGKELGPLLRIWQGRDLTHGLAWLAQLDLLENKIKRIMEEVAFRPERFNRTFCNDGSGLDPCVHYGSHQPHVACG